MFALLLGSRRSCSSRMVSRREAVQAAAEPLLAQCAGVPCGRGLRVVGDGEDQAPELGVLGPDAFFTRGFAPFELATR